MSRPKPHPTVYIAVRTLQMICLAVSFVCLAITLMSTYQNATLNIVRPDPDLSIQPYTSDQKVELIKREHSCSTEGYGNKIIPAYAIVQDSDGDVRLTTFEAGWEYRLDNDPKTTLVEVCEW